MAFLYINIVKFVAKRGQNMLKRKFTETLKQWKNSKKRECLLVNGARQVGKTFIIDVFGRENYKSYIYLNLFKNPEYKQIFEGDLEPAEIYKRISLLVKNVKFIEGDTLIFIDEIQACSKARTALKFLAMDDKYDIIASGSLLGLHYNKLRQEKADEISIPVGYEREVEMHSLDFEEFLWATGVSEIAVENLKEFYEQKKSPVRHHQGSVPKQTPRIPRDRRHACRGERLR